MATNQVRLRSIAMPTITAAHRVRTIEKRISTMSPTQGTFSTTFHGTQ